MTYPLLPRNKSQTRYTTVVLPLTGGARPLPVLRPIVRCLGPTKHAGRTLRDVEVILIEEGYTTVALNGWVSKDTLRAKSNQPWTCANGTHHGGNNTFNIKISKHGMLRMACVFSGDCKQKVGPNSGIFGQIPAYPEHELECYTHFRGDRITP